MIACNEPWRSKTWALQAGQTAFCSGFTNAGLATSNPQRRTISMHTVAKTGLIASAVLGLFACASNTAHPVAPSGTASASVKCGGINSCKGQGQCAGNGHSCGMHTSCKGQGWLSTATAEECAQKGGKVL
jgi:hypothetical protein